jgi:hypothetical protein
MLYFNGSIQDVGWDNVGVRRWTACGLGHVKVVGVGKRLFVDLMGHEFESISIRK